MSLCINSYDDIYVAIFNVPRTYLNAYILDAKFILINFDNEFVDIMCDVNLELVDDIKLENRKKVQYLRIVKDLYICIESTLLWFIFLDKIT